MAKSRPSEKQNNMSEKMFAPKLHDSFKEVPKDQKDNFTKEKGGSFVYKEAADEFKRAKAIIELANEFKKNGTDVKKILSSRAKGGILRESAEAARDDNTLMDVLREEAKKDRIESTDIDLMRKKAERMYYEEHPEERYLERIRNNDPDALKGVPRNIWENKKFVMEAVKYSKKALGKVKGDLRRDEEVALEAVRHNGLALQYGWGFRDNVKVVIEAIKQNPDAIKYASKEIKRDLRELK